MQINKLTPEQRSFVFWYGPAFLRDASVSIRKQFMDTLSNPNFTGTEKKEKAKELAKKFLNPKQMEEFKKYVAVRDRIKQEFDEKVRNLSPEAKKVFDELKELRERRLEIYRQMTPEVKAEISGLYIRRKSTKKSH
ncbi:hypothetical protein AB6A40_008165 [Gnathostoma spinigerum]|uniref:Periplasmic heavy metal sensor n=1 Tax=Gnathostoma spinigerum TaxID=75299 RepID=A0ABD6ENR9_9BILA